MFEPVSELAPYLGPIIVVTKDLTKVLASCGRWLLRRKKGTLAPADLHLLGDRVGVVIGDGNLHALQADPDAGASEYIRSAAGHFLSAVGDMRPSVSYVEADDLLRERDLGGVLLGGPVANRAYREYCGYTLVPAEGEGAAIPTWEPKGLRWGFFLGVGQWGATPASRSLDSDSPLELLTASRWRPDGRVKSGAPRYGIVDSTGRISMLAVDDHNRVVEDYALITRLERKDAPGRYLVLVAGAHGYATAAFGRSWRKHVGFLRKVAGDVGDEFQVLIPAELDYSSGIDRVALDLRRASTAAVGAVK